MLIKLESNYKSIKIIIFLKKSLRSKNFTLVICMCIYNKNDKKKNANQCVY